MKITGVSRRALFEQLDRPALVPLPRDALRAGGMEAVSRQHRLSRRGRSQLLQRAVSARARAGRGACSRRRPSKSSSRAGASRRMLRLTGRGRFATQVGAHAARASGARGMDAVAPDRVGRTDRPGDRPARRGHPRAPAASRARLPRVPRADAARAARTAPIGSKPPVRGPSGSAPIAIAPSNTFSSTSRTGSRSRIRPLPVRR